MREHIFEIASIKEGFINNDKFYINQNDAADSKFNYGREVIKNSREETNELPYSKIKLFSSSGKQTTKIHKFVTSGLHKGAIFKGGIRLTLAGNDADLETTSFIGGTKKNEKMLENFKFSIFEDYMMALFGRIRQIKVRIMILRATNLAA